MADTAVILAAAGQGKRMGAPVNKVLLELGGRPLLAYSLQLFEALDDVAEIVLVAHPDETGYMKEMIVSKYAGSKPVKVVAGGKERQDSVRNGLAAVDPKLGLVAVHDGARPLVSADLARRLIAAARAHGAACPGVAAKDTLREGQDEIFGKTLDRSRIYQIQTPQVFRRESLIQAFDKADADQWMATDDAALYERYIGPVRLVTGEYRNLKITTGDDLLAAEGMLGAAGEDRCGTGFDVHRLVQGRKLIIGGVEVPWEKGLLGHSDADVLLHAISDALLGAAALGDIGKHFPDSDERYRGISSLVLLSHVGVKIADAGFTVLNIDATVIAEKPKMAPYITTMRERIAEALKIETDRVSVKATTTEGLGFTGRGEGIAAQAAAMLRKVR
ncbi:MAG: 2-C-methyl-D-erythritol 4-phosphate cytidylyltransferase [Solirubrobacterales bacterium]